MRLQITRVYIGYNNKNKKYSNKNTQQQYPSPVLVKVHFKQSELDNITCKVGLKTYNPQSLNKASENPTRVQSSFSIYTGVTKNSVEDNYYTQIIAHLYNYICKNDMKIQSLKNSKNLKKCKYVIYFGYRYDLDNNNRINKLPILLLFPFKTNFKFTEKKNSGVFHGPFKGNYFKFVSNTKLFQLPFSKLDNIANFYRMNNSEILKYKKELKTSNNINKEFILKVYNSSKFDDVFDTNKLKKYLACAHIEAFQNNELEIASNSIHVHFQNEANIEKLINSKTNNSKIKDLINNISTFTGSKNSTIQKVNIDQVKDALNILNKNCDKPEYSFNKKSIPKLTYSEKEKEFKLIVNKDNILIFSFLLRNKIVEKILDKHIYMPGIR